MNENVNNNQNFEPVDNNQKKEGIGKKIWKGIKCVLKVAVPVAVGAAGGYVARKYVDKDIYADAQAQREYRERKESRNNG